MQITGTASITLAGDPAKPLDAKTLEKIQGELTDALSARLDEVMAKYGFENQQVHSCMLDDLEIDEPWDEE